MTRTMSSSIGTLRQPRSLTTTQLMGRKYNSSFYRSSIELLRDERFTDGKNEPLLLYTDPYLAVPAAGL